MAIVVFMHNGFDCDGHEAGGEEHSDGIFEGERKLIVCFVVMVF